MQRFPDPPKDLVGNLAYRAAIDLLARGSEEFARMVRYQFAHDIVWAVNTFFWTRDTRLEITDRPFILMDFQEPVLKTIKANAKRDTVVVKPRDMGMSWLPLARFVHGFVTLRGVNFHCISRNEDSVDSSSDPNSLFWKVNYMLDMLPEYLRPKFQHKHLLFTNHENGCTITGEATSRNAGRGSRALQILVDECASIDYLGDIMQNVSSTAPAMIWVSTVKGTGGFYQLSLREDASQVRVGWLDDPRKTENLRPLAGSKYYDLLKDFTEVTSDWLEAQCGKLVDRYRIAQEIFCRFDATDHRFFPSDLCKGWLEKCRVPFCAGALNHNESFSEISFTRLEQGWMKCFVDPKKIEADVAEKKVKRWVISCDIAYGSGSSNSVAMLSDADAKTQLATIKTPHKDPVAFAHLVYALWLWTGRPYVIWEVNGPGSIFTKTLMGLGIGNCYLRETSETSLDRKIKMEPGWLSTTQLKNDLFSAFRHALMSGGFIPIDDTLVKEFDKIVYRQGDVTHADQTDPDEESDARAAHADQVIAAALAVKAFSQIGPPPTPVVKAPEPPKNSMAGRRAMFAHTGASW